MAGKYSKEVRMECSFGAGILNEQGSVISCFSRNSRRSRYRQMRLLVIYSELCNNIRKLLVKEGGIAVVRPLYAFCLQRAFYMTKYIFKYLNIENCKQKFNVKREAEAQKDKVVLGHWIRVDSFSLNSI